jgi:hypothetical protein
MTRQSLVLFPVVLMLLASSGCRWSRSAPPPKVAAAPVAASDQARKELATVAKKIEGDGAVETIETYIKKFEDPEQNWTWADLNEMMNGYSYQTKVAYEKWRAAVVKESGKR